MKILIVDDKEEERYLAETLLKGSGYEVVTAVNGAEALEKLRAEGFDMIVSDILMPVMDGFQLCKECKEDEKLRDIPFVFHTAEYAKEEDKNLASKLGAAKFIRKPIEPDEFIKLIQGVFRDMEEGEKKPVTVGMKILVVEDNEDSRNLLVKQLHAYGHEVMATADGTEALEQALAQPPDIIVSDIMMPKMDGYQLCHEWKQNDKLKDIPFVFYTATYTREEDEKFALSLGADAFFNKPTEPDILVQILFEIVEKATSGLQPSAKVAPIEPSLFLAEHDKRIFTKLEDKVAQLEAEITERKRAQEELQLAEQNFRNSLDNSPLGIYIVTAEGELLYANQSILDIYGYSSVEELKATPIKKRYTPKSSAEYQERKERRKLGKPVPPSYEVSIVRKDGEVRHLIASRKEVLWNSEVQYQTIYQDITERKRVEHNLDERMKELSCLYSIAAISERKDFTLDKLYLEVINILPSSWQYLEITCARITIDGKSYKTKNCRETPWKQSSDIKVHGEKVGVVQVGYLEEKPELDEGPFSKEERSLIDAVAERLARIIERKKAEERLRQSEENLRVYFESAPDGIYVNDLKGTFLYGNKRSEEITGYKRGELIRNTFLKLKLLSAKDIARASKLLALSVMGKSTGPDEFELIRKDGSLVWVEITTTPVKQRGKTVVIGFVRDITKRKQTEEKIKHAAEEWRTTFDSITDLVSIHNKDFRLVRVNKAFADILKKKPKELIGKPCYEMVHGTKEPPPNCPHKKTIKTKKPAIAEFFEPNLGIHLEVATSPIFNDKGDVVASVQVIRDITERKKMEEQLIVTDRLASIGELSSGIAHELNNPLTAVIGFSDLLLARDLPDDIKEDLKVINREARRTAGVVRNLLTFARKHPEEKQSVHVNKVIQGVLELRAYEQRVNNIEVNTHFASDLPEITANGFELQQVFINIIINAEHFMSEAHGRGTLTITTERAGDIIRASFADDGRGIPKENLGHLLNPFFTTKEVGKGTGLGLSICHGIITEHGGRIYAESELGKGATFVVELPVTNPDKGGANK